MTDLDPDPLSQLRLWLEEAERVCPLAQAMTLATATRDAAPSARIVLLHAIDDRGCESRLAAWSSPQSRSLPDRDALDRLYARAAELFPGEDVPLPPFWGGYRVLPETVELWAHRENRLHDRIRYSLAGREWRRERLAP